MTLQGETIVAISTPPGRGGIGIVRLAGEHAVTVAQTLLRVAQPLEHHRARFGHLLDADGGVVDECVVTLFRGPHSYTGDDVVEIAAHGSPVVLEHAVARALAAGARLAEPGEFSRRAFLNGRLDLTQAEAIHDLIAAQTLAQARTAAQQLGGALSRRVAPIKGQLLQLIAELEAGMDFASGELDDVDTLPPARIAVGLAEVQSPLSALAGSFRAGSLQRNGLKLALVGRPNAGKSSLFNRLLQRERAIVTAAPGTTRDTLEETVAIGGIPIRLVDTAGLRSTHSDEAEALGIARSHEAIADADLVVVVRDATMEADNIGAELDPLLAGRPVVWVRNKIDLAPAAYLQSDAREGAAEIRTSALTGEGITELRNAVLAQVRSGAAGADEAALNTLRQKQAVDAALHALEAAEAANASGMPHEMLLVDLHEALRALDALTGVTTTDDILGMIFAQFCIGK